MNFIKKTAAVLLVTMLVLSSIPLNVLGINQGSQTPDTIVFADGDVSENIDVTEKVPNGPKVKTITKSAITASNGTNLLKIKNGEFSAGHLNDLKTDENGDLTLESGKKTGVYYSPIYEGLDFEYLVASWNAYLPGESTIEVEATAFIAKDPTEDPNVGEWSEYLSWGEWGPQIRSGSKSTESGKTTLAYMSVDEFTVRTPGSASNQGATKVQFRVTLKQGENTEEQPVLRQVSATWANTVRKINRGYAEVPTTTASSIRIKAPAYSQNVRDPAIGSSICNPTTLTVMLNQRNSELDLLPEELALTVQDFEYGFGNWSYTGSAPGLYGYESYAQYGDFDIIRQELSKGHTVGMSVRYASYKNGPYPYLETGATNSTGGHLITLTGFYYDKAIGDYVYYSSDSATPNDYVASGEHRRYQENHLKEASSYSKTLIYIIPSTTPTGIKVSGIERIDAELNPAGNVDNEYELFAGGKQIKLSPSFTEKKQDILERGTLAYTIDGIRTEIPDNVIEGLTANNVFFYDNIAVNQSGNIEFDVNTAFRENNIPVGEEREVTFYIMLNTAKSYRATLELERTEDIYVSSSDGYCDLTVDGDKIYVYGEVSGEGSLIELTFKAPDSPNEVVKNINAKQLQILTVEREGGLQTDYTVDTRDVIVASDDTKEAKGKNIIFINDEEFLAEESSFINVIFENNAVTLNSDDIGYYYSPVYEVDNFRFITASWEAVTPGKSSVEVEVRGYRDSDRDSTGKSSWTQWYSFGEWGTGIKSTSKAFSNLKGTMDVDVLSFASSEFNANKFQVRVTLKSDGENSPKLYNVIAAFREYDGGLANADISGNIEKPENFKAYSAYSYFSKMSGWRFENMMLMLLNNQGADLLFEEVALYGYDFAAGAGNWVFTPSRAKALGYTGFLQYGSSTDVIKEYINKGVAVGILANTNYLDSTSANVSRPIIVYDYDERTETFSLVCPSGDTNELNKGDVYFESSESVLQEAIDNCGNAPGRWLMFIIGADSNDENNINRTKASINKKSDLVYELSVKSKKVALPDDFIASYNSKSGGGVIMYSLESENPNGTHKLADRKYYYDITVDNGNLKITEDLKTKIDKGETVQLFVVTNDGVTYQSTLKKESGSSGGGTTPGKGTTVTPPASENKADNFTDISSNMWYYEAVKYVANNNIMMGTSETQFSPDLFLTREMAVTVLYRYAKEPGIFNIADYSDVKSGDYFYNAVSWATGLGIVKGYGNSIFGTGNNLTREDFAVILYRHAKSAGMDVSGGSDLSRFTDSGQISPWAAEALEWATSIGLIVGKTNTALAPKDAVTRAEAAAIIMRYSEL